MKEEIEKKKRKKREKYSKILRNRKNNKKISNEEEKCIGKKDNFGYSCLQATKESDNSSLGNSTRVSLACSGMTILLHIMTKYVGPHERI